MLRPLVLTGGPAVGKSSTARLLALSRPRAAVIDVDDVRHLVVAGHAAPWDGEEGRRQQRLGVENACDLASRFLDHAVEVVMADVVTPDTLPLYRRRLPTAFVVHLEVTLSEARRRAATRRVYLSADEFAALHAADGSDPPAADRHVDVTQLSLDQQVAAVAALWHETA